MAQVFSRTSSVCSNASLDRLSQTPSASTHQDPAHMTRAPSVDTDKSAATPAGVGDVFFDADWGRRKRRWLVSRVSVWAASRRGSSRHPSSHAYAPTILCMWLSPVRLASWCLSCAPPVPLPTRRHLTRRPPAAIPHASHLRQAPRTLPRWCAPKRALSKMKHSRSWRSNMSGLLAILT